MRRTPPEPPSQALGTPGACDTSGASGSYAAGGTGSAGGSAGAPVSEAGAAAAGLALSKSVSGADALLRRLEWTVIRRLDGALQGDYRTLFRGAGLDLADLREYQHHDDVRHIDWNVTARLQVPHVREFTEDRDVTAWFVLDLSGSVHFGSGETSKLGLAEGLVAVLARLLTRHGNRVGAFRYRDRVDGHLPPRGGRTQVLRLISLLKAGEAPLPASGSSAAHGARGTRLDELLRAAETGIRRRAMVFVVSDFVSEGGWEAPLGRLAQRHDVLAVRLFDPLEKALPDLGLLTVEDAETGEQIFIDTHDRGFRKRFEAIAAEREDALRASLARAGVDVLELGTGDDLHESLMRFADLRRRRVRLVPGASMRATAAPLSAMAPAAVTGARA